MAQFLLLNGDLKKKDENASVVVENGSEHRLLITAQKVNQPQLGKSIKFKLSQSNKKII